MPIVFNTDNKDYDMNCSLKVSEFEGMIMVEITDNTDGSLYRVLLNSNSGKHFSEEFNSILKNITVIPKIGKPSLF